MITIQSQDKQLWEGNHIGNGYDKEKALLYCSGYVVGSYDTVMNRDYVLEQIALAIERGDKLYRMPSVEEVENKINSGKSCCECMYITIHTPNKWCSACKFGFTNWKPKE